MNLRSEKPFLTFLRRPGTWKILLLGVLGAVILVAAAGKSDAVDSDGELSAYGAALEARVEELVEAVDGVGRAEVMIAFSSGTESVKRTTGSTVTVPPKVLSVTVVCDGGGRDATVLALREMLSAAFDVPKSRVSVMKLK